MNLFKKKRPQADKLPDGVTIENGFRYLTAIDRAIDAGIMNVEAERRQSVLAMYKAAFYAEIKAVDAVAKKLKIEG